MNRTNGAVLIIALFLLFTIMPAFVHSETLSVTLATTSGNNILSPGQSATITGNFTFRNFSEYIFDSRETIQCTVYRSIGSNNSTYTPITTIKVTESEANFLIYKLTATSAVKPGQYNFKILGVDTEDHDLDYQGGSNSILLTLTVLPRTTTSTSTSTTSTTSSSSTTLKTTATTSSTTTTMHSTSSTISEHPTTTILHPTTTTIPANSTTTSTTSSSTTSTSTSTTNSTVSTVPTTSVGGGGGGGPVTGGPPPSTSAATTASTSTIQQLIEETNPITAGKPNATANAIHSTTTTAPTTTTTLSSTTTLAPTSSSGLKAAPPPSSLTSPVSSDFAKWIILIIILILAIVDLTGYYYVHGRRTARQEADKAQSAE